MRAVGAGCCLETVVVLEAVQCFSSSELRQKRDVGSDVGCSLMGSSSFPSAEVSLGVLDALTQRRGVRDDLCGCVVISVCGSS